MSDSTEEARTRLCNVLGVTPEVVDDWVIFSVAAVRIQRLESEIEALRKPHVPYNVGTFYRED